jgi:hypothetical protein
MRSSLLRHLRVFVILVLAFSSCVWAGDWSGPVTQVAQKILADTGPGAISLEIVNRSSLSTADVDSIRAGIGQHLAAGGVRLVAPDQASATVQIALSENLQNYVWVCTIQQGSDSKVEIVSLPRADTPPPINEPAQLAIRKIQVWSQDQRILDVAVIDSSPPQVIVLDADKITIYGLHGQWQMQQSFPVTHTRPWPRDLRGRIVLRPDHLLDAYLPGVLCSSTVSPLSITCRESDDPWPVGTQQKSLSAFFSPTRNFFTGALAPGIGKDRTVPRFYSAAPIPREKYVLWLFAGVDGQIREVDGMNDPVSAGVNWGSDIAAVKTTCGSGWQILATSNGDGAMPDTLRAYEFPDRDPVPVSLPVEVNGTVTALWSELHANGVIAVVHNRQTGKYEAFRIEIACGQ